MIAFAHTRLSARFKRDLTLIQGGILRRGLLASLVMIVFIVIQSGTIFQFVETRDGAVVQDFWAFHAAAEGTLKGGAAALYEKEAFQALFADARGLLWLYPPTMLVLIAPFGLLSYGAAKTIWLIASVVAMIAAARFLTGKNAFLTVIALLSPAFFAAMFTGQLSVIFAGLLAAGLFFAKTRPIIAGVCLGLLTVKPQLGLLVPVFLVLTGSWRAIAWAALTALALATVSLLAFGAESWAAFFASLTQTHSDFVQSYGHPGRVTLPDALQILGWRSAPTAAITAMAVMICAAMLYFAKRAHAQWRALAALTMILTVISAPYFWVYDWAFVAFAILLFISGRPSLSVNAQVALVAAWFAALSPYLGGGKYAVPLIWAVLAYVGWIIFDCARKQSRPHSQFIESKNVV